MHPTTPSVAADSTPRWMFWTGRVLSALVALQMLSSAFFRGTQHAYAVTEIVDGYGFPESAILPIVLAECTLVLLYLIPRTAVLAAILLAGYLGGAIAAHVRVGDMARSVIPLAVAMMAWGGLYLRDARIRHLIPFRRQA